MVEVSTDLSRASVLLVDDVRANLIALSALLKPLGARLVEAQSAKDALSAIRQEPFAVALLDVQMPEMDGFQLATAIRQLEYGRQLPILFVTAIHRDDMYVKRGYAVGAADYITKPFDADIVRARVKGFVDLFEGSGRLRGEELSRRTSERDDAHRKLKAFERIAAASLEEPQLQIFFRDLLAEFLNAADTADSAAIIEREHDRYVVRASAGTNRDVYLKVPELIGDVAPLIADLANRNGNHGGKVHALPTIADPSSRVALSVVPIVNAREISGLACIGSSKATSFSEGDLTLFKAVSERASWALAQQLERRQLQEVSEVMPAMISIVSMPSMKYVFASPEFRAIFPIADPVGANASEIGMGSAAVKIIKDAYHSGRTVLVDELAFFQNGKERFVQFSAHPLRNHAGIVDRILTFATEVTSLVDARHRIEEHEAEHAVMLEKEHLLRAEAERANQAKDEFLATISHELRTPLQAILGWTTLSLRNAPAEMRHALETIERNAKRQTTLIEDLLDVSRITNGNLRLERYPLDVSELVNAAVEAIRPAAKAKNIGIGLKLPARMDLHGDGDRLQQVFANILSNACKFTPEGGHISVRGEFSAKRILIHIVDTGEGIEPAILPLVFDPFRQGSGSTTRRHSGLGLGLTLAKRLVEAHSGIIDVASPGPGKGTTVTIELPRNQSAGAADTEKSADGQVRDVRKQSLNYLKILIVDDDEEARSLLSTLLAEHHGATVTTAESAVQAIEVVKQFHPDLIVSDLAMPNEDGYEFMRSVRNLPAGSGGDTPAIALSAQGRAEDGGRALAAGFQGYVAKPVEVDRLIAAITSHCPRPST